MAADRGQEGDEDPGLRWDDEQSNASRADAGAVGLPGALPPTAAIRGVRRPKWRLCFRMDREAMNEQAANDIAWKHQRDFFVTIVDPPALSLSLPPPPFFVSQLACQVANLLVGRPFLQHLPGTTFKSRAVAVVGKDCVTSGFVAAMLGARVAFVSERAHFQHVQHNLRLYLRDALDYTKVKSSTVCATCASRPGSLDSLELCDQLSAAPPLDLVLCSTSAAVTVCSEVRTGIAAHGEHVLSCREDMSDKLFEVLDSLVPSKSPSRVLLVDDEGLVAGMNLPGPDDGNDTGLVGPQAFPQDLDAENATCYVPEDWQVRPFCLLLGRYPVLWLERIDTRQALKVRRRPLQPMRKYLPPMGSSSARCGCGGHPQSMFLNKRIINPDWVDSHARLREALTVHNRWKLNETFAMLNDVNAWRQARSSRPSTVYGGARPSSMEASQTPRDLRAETSATIGSSDMAGSRPADTAFQSSRSRSSAASIATATAKSMEPTIGHGRRGSSRLTPGSLGPDRPATAPAAHFAPVFPGTAPVPEPMGDGGDESLDETPESQPLGPPVVTMQQRERVPSRLLPVTVAARRRQREQFVGKTIAERHASPPHWYRCNRQVYGSPARQGSHSAGQQ